MPVVLKKNRYLLPPNLPEQPGVVIKFPGSSGARER